MDYLEQLYAFRSASPDKIHKVMKELPSVIVRENSCWPGDVPDKRKKVILFLSFKMLGARLRKW